MSASSSAPEYPLGNTDAEHERLIWQSERLAPLTERLFQQAGIGPGHRVLDLGSGVGDVAMLAARFVGPSGEVVGVERDQRSIARARLRVAEAGLRNVTFIESDISRVTMNTPFDAAVGRAILMWLPDPGSVLRSLAQLVRPGGILAFQEPDWRPILALLKPLPLWSAAASLVHHVALGSGANPDMGYTLYRVFQAASLPRPAMNLEMPMGRNPDFARYYAETLRSLWPRIQQLNLPHESVGNLDTLLERLQAEVESSRYVAAWLAFVGAWTRK
jgi:ubiquinone/menaquinone biosynthesis C-methylase UbiE